MSKGKHMRGISNKCTWIIDTGFRLKNCDKPKPCPLHESQPESTPMNELKPFIDRLKKLKTGSTLTSGDVSALIAIEEYFTRPTPTPEPPLRAWGKGYHSKTGHCQWIWEGPVICGFELAQWGLRERNGKEKHEKA